MRNLILTVLLASSVAMPAVAQDRDFRQRDRSARNASEPGDEARGARRAQRSQQAERQRPQAAERSARREAREQAVQQPQAAEQQVVRRRAFGQQQQAGERRNWGQRRSNNDGMAAAIERQQQAAQARAQSQSLEQRQRDYRRDGRGREGRSRDGSLLGRALENSYARDGQVEVRRDRDDRARSRYSGSNRQWSNQWRGDRNYDWRNHRNRNRSVFRLGNYWDPYGSSYRRFSIGFNLFPNYYQSNNWLNDPWMYRLPPAYGPYRWVRYYDDALLVNIYNGQVVDVVHSFFW